MDAASDTYRPEPGSGLAIAALVLAILGFCIPGLSLIGLILGVIALVGATKTPPTAGGKGLAIASISVGGVGLLLMIIAIPLIGIMLPALGQARGAARQVMSQTQMRGITQAMAVYAANNEDMLPPADGWDHLLIYQGLISPELLVAPYVEAGTYTMADLDATLDGTPAAGPFVTPPSYFYVPAETNTFDARQILLYQHPALDPNGGIIAFHDAHVEYIQNPEYTEIIENIILEDGTPWAPHRDYPINP